MVWRLGCSVVDSWLHIVVIMGTKTMNVHCGGAIFIISLITQHRLVFHVQSNVSRIQDCSEDHWSYFSSMGVQNYDEILTKVFTALNFQLVSSLAFRLRSLDVLLSPAL